MHGEVLLRIKAVKEKTGLKHALLYKMIRAGKFPKPIKLSERCVAWLLSDIEAFIQDRIAASRTGSRDGESYCSIYIYIGNKYTEHFLQLCKVRRDQQGYQLGSSASVKRIWAISQRRFEAATNMYVICNVQNASKVSSFYHREPCASMLRR